ncbi:MAG: hypothetical protein AAB893_03690 [Patescibacteria group bacterium]
METKDQANTKDTSTSRRPNLKKMIVENWVVFFLGAMVVAFGAGFSAYKTIVEIANQEIVPKGCCVPKDGLVGKILKTEVIGEIDHLIEIGQSAKNNEADTTVWLMRVLTFIQSLNLEENRQWNGNRVSAIEVNMQYVLLDRSPEIQRQKTVGILLGFKAAFQTQVTK